MNKKIARMMKEIERRGGKIGMNSALPDDVAELFLAEILDCPDCLEVAAANGVALADQPPARTSRRRTSKDH